jgi:hypothetical protein
MTKLQSKLRTPKEAAALLPNPSPNSALPKMYFCAWSQFAVLLNTFNQANSSCHFSISRCSFFANAKRTQIAATQGGKLYLQCTRNLDNGLPRQFHR